MARPGLAWTRWPGVVVCLAAAVPVPAGAAAATTTFLVTLAVQASCTVSATALAFGSYAAVQLDATATITATCTSTTPYYINCGDGLNPGPGYVPRMLGGADNTLVSYTPYRDAARTQRWGNTYNSDGVAATGTGTAQAFTMYGRVPADQFGPPATYTDTLVITVTY